MKRYMLYCFLLLFAGGVLQAQDIWDLEEQYKTKEAKKDKQLIDLISLHQLGHRIGEKADELAFAAPKGSSTQGVYLRKALLYYSLSANYAQIAVDQFNSKSMGQQKVKSCEKATFYYRALGKPKIIHEKRFIDACDLLKTAGEDDPAGDDEDTSDQGKGDPSGPLYDYEEFEKTLIGKRLFFKTPKQTFSMMVYEPFVITEEQSIQQAMVKKQFEQVIKMLPKEQRAAQRKETYDKLGRAHWYNFGKDLGGVIFFAEDQGGKDIKLLCDETDSKTGIAYKTSVSGARACIASIYKHPKTGERLKGGSTIVQVEHKGDLFQLLLVAGKNYNTSKHEKILRVMARSLRMEGVTELPTITVKKCKEDAVMPLAKGIPVSWTMFDRKRKAIVVQQPVMARDAGIGDAVSNYFGLVLKVINWTKDARQIMNFTKGLVVDRDLKKSLLTTGQWQLEHHVTKMEFIPTEIEDYSSFNYDGLLTNAAIFYLEALQKVSTGISGLGRKLNKKSMRLYYEIPTVTVEAECIPQMICKNGKWVPDWNNLTYRRIKTTYGKITSPNKDFMSIRDVERDLQRYFKDKIYELEQSERDYARILNRCDDSKGQLYKIDFPVHIDKCPVLEGKIQIVQYETLFKEKVQNARKEEMRRWLTVLKPAEKSKYTGRLLELKTQKDAMNVDLNKKIKLREGHITNGNEGEAARLEVEIGFLREDIALIESFETKTQAALGVVNSGSRERAMSQELSAISTEISNLKKQKEALKKQLQQCVKDYDKLR
ncbi:hypothetical protein POV27_08010 [Aureisphaera galaxeae]|uniref:hypothetical protein n=1 Tax=Aureisphaera galaxeae TaxID=1538023 RepID=UPI0023505AB8|nr:hypothetical protein [Aureisphaera galaxeae]MDC8003993.1 hypothetical protein [Aureisphaera galaxeae]